MYIDTNYFMFINIGVILILVISVLLAYKNGFVYQALNLVSFVVAFLASMTLAPTLSRYFPLFTDYVSVSDAISKTFMNIALWYVIVFVVFKLVLAILLVVAKIFNKIPLIGGVNKILGALMGVVTGAIWILLLTTLLATPLFSNGKEVINHTIIKPLSEIADKAVVKMGEYIDLDAIGDHLSGDMGQLDNISEAFETWLIENGFTEQ